MSAATPTFRRMRQRRGSLIVPWVLMLACFSWSVRSPIKAAEQQALVPSENHWAYQSLGPRRVSPSPAGVHSREISEIDQFVRERLQREGLTPSPEAPPHTLIRRLYMDLLGLPPSPEQVSSFLADYSSGPETAWKRQVDHCLSSPHFGERWGRHWLDHARYADSDGYEKDSPRPDAWRYREWVIDSFNRDQPFDQFTLEQLAGDLLPQATPDQRLATAFHRQTLTNREGGVEQEQYRVEAVFDRIETTATVWLGLTLGCARCHDHKYERLSQREYYQLYAFFDNADEANARVGQSRQALEDYGARRPEDLVRILACEARVKASRDELAKGFSAWESNTIATLKALEGVQPKTTHLPLTNLSGPLGITFIALPDGIWAATNVSILPATYTVIGTLPAGLVHGLHLEVFPDPEGRPRGTTTNEASFLLTEFIVEIDGNRQPLHSPKADFEAKDGAVANLLDGKGGTGWSVTPKSAEPHHATFCLQRPIESDGTLQIRFTLQQDSTNLLAQLGRFRLSVVTNATEDSVAPPDVRRLARIGIEKWTEPDRERLFEWLTDQNVAAREAREALARAEKTAKAPLMSARVLVERSDPRQTRVLNRGEYLHPKEPVKPGVPGILPPLVTSPDHRPNRLDLARWIVSPDHPLTSRVAANQIWQHLMGEGLVRTPADFGMRGEKPSHPELFDWLAQELIRSGWSRKQLIRRIVHSATYRQSSTHRTDLLERDPLNRLLARQNRQRVEAEIVRDVQLAVSGLLNRSIGGASVYPALPPDVAKISYANNFKWPESKGADRYRRGMYTFFKRTAPHPDLTTFDCPDANLTNVRRNISNTPLQALAVLNAQTFTEAALELARTLLATAGQTDTRRLQDAFERCLSRPPQAYELASLQELLASSRTYYRVHPKDAALLTSDTTERSEELAAWIATLRVLLNTDELLTRE